MQITLHFHSIAAKNAFNRVNKFSVTEILAEGSAWQAIMTDGNDYAASPFVYSVSC